MICPYFPNRKAAVTPLRTSDLFKLTLSPKCSLFCSLSNFLGRKKMRDPQTVDSDTIVTPVDTNADNSSDSTASKSATRPTRRVGLVQMHSGLDNLSLQDASGLEGGGTVLDTGQPESEAYSILPGVTITLTEPDTGSLGGGDFSDGSAVTGDTSAKDSAEEEEDTVPDLSLSSLRRKVRKGSYNRPLRLVIPEGGKSIEGRTTFVTPNTTSRETFTLETLEFITCILSENDNYHVDDVIGLSFSDPQLKTIVSRRQLFVGINIYPWLMIPVQKCIIFFLTLVIYLIFFMRNTRYIF